MPEQNQPGDKFKERAYEILYKKYRLIIFNMQRYARARIESEENKSVAEHFENVANPEKYPIFGITKTEDLAVIDALEHCLGLESLLKNKK